MKRLDAWLIGLMEKFLDLLEDWLAVPQKQFERFVLVVYAASAIEHLFYRSAGIPTAGPFTPLWLDVALTIGMVLNMLGHHKSPAAMRRLHRQAMWWFRLLGMLALISSTTLMTIIGGRISPRDVLEMVEIIAIVSFFYAIVANCGQDGGRRKRVPFAKLRELFGTLWTPAPEGARG